MFLAHPTFTFVRRNTARVQVMLWGKARLTFQSQSFPLAPQTPGPRQSHRLKSVLMSKKPQSWKVSRMVSDFQDCFRNQGISKVSFGLENPSR